MVEPQHDKSQVEEMASTVIAECVAYRARRLNRQVTSIFNDALRSSPLSITEMNLLAPIAARPGVQPSALANAMAMDKSTLSRNLARLSGREYIRIAAHPEERGDSLWLTNRGREAFVATFQAWKRAQDHVATLIDGPVPNLEF